MSICACLCSHHQSVADATIGLELSNASSSEREEMNLYLTEALEVLKLDDEEDDMLD